MENRKNFFFLDTLLSITILYASYLLIILSLPYIHFISDVDFLLTKQLIYHIKTWRISFYVHVFSSSFIILSGLFQFNRFVIYKKKQLHKFLGYIYIILVLFVSGPSAFIMSLYANGGIPAQISFTLLSVIWILSTAISFLAIRKGKIEKHAKWLLRSYALTLSAVTLRFYAYLFDAFNIPLHPIDTYIVLTWISWIPNLIICEILIRKGYIRSLLNPN